MWACLRTPVACGVIVSWTSSNACWRLRALVLEETRGLVVPAVRDLGQLLLVLLAMVSAEEELPVVHDNANVRLGAAAVATVGRDASSSTAPFSVVIVDM
jgi:hypothetical protein